MLLCPLARSLGSRRRGQVFLHALVRSRRNVRSEAATSGGSMDTMAPRMMRGVA